MEEKMFDVGIWSVQFGYDNQGWPNLERAAQFIESSGQPEPSALADKSIYLVISSFINNNRSRNVWLSFN